MQQVRSNREPLNESIGREGVVGESPAVVHSDLSSLFNDYTYSQQHCMTSFFCFFLLPN